MHFVGQLAYEDPATAADRVRITPKKKVVRITIDREVVVKPKKEKEPKVRGPKEGKGPKEGSAKDAKLRLKGEDMEFDLKRRPDLQAELKPAPAAQPNPEYAQPPSTTPTASRAPAPVPAATGAEHAAPQTSEQSAEEQLKASIAAAPEAERPADAASVTTTTSPAHSTKVLKEALDRIFAPGLDERMMAAMPDYWRLYWQAVAAKSDYRPADPGVLRQNTVDKKARLVSNFEPDSNEFAQAAGVAGMALYHTVVGTDGRAGEIVVGRPIGFGLDENAVASIRKAQFEPAMKDGKPVPVLLDLVVQFRIFSKRTGIHAAPEQEKPAEKQLPGPFTVQKVPVEPSATAEPKP